jgi:hypothetical protein
VTRWRPVLMGLLGFLGTLAAGAGILAFGVWYYRRPVTCEGKEMSGGDICVTETESGGEVSRETYYDLLGSQQDLGFFVGFVGGVVMLLAFGVPLFMGAGNLRERLSMRRARRGVATITPRPMTVILLGVLAILGGGIAVALNVQAIVDPVLCEGEPLGQGEFCEASGNSYTDQEDEQKVVPGIITFTGGAVALGGVLGGVWALRARRQGKWRAS